MDTTMPGIEAAYEGRRKMLRAIFGGDDEPPKPQDPRTVSVAAQLDAFSKVMNKK